MPSKIEILETNKKPANGCVPHQLIKEVYETTTVVNGKLKVTANAALVNKTIRSKGEKPGKDMTDAEIEAKKEVDRKTVEIHNKKLLDEAMAKEE